MTKWYAEDHPSVTLDYTRTVKLLRELHPTNHNLSADNMLNVAMVEIVFPDDGNDHDGDGDGEDDRMTAFIAEVLTPGV